MCYGSGGGNLETVTRDCRRLNGLACSPGFGQQKMYMEGGSQARAGGDAINKCLGSILAAPRMGWGWARAHGKAPARGRCGRPENCNGDWWCQYLPPESNTSGVLGFGGVSAICKRSSHRGCGHRRRRRALRPTVFFRPTVFTSVNIFT